MKTIAVKVKGLSSLLMHSFPMVPIDGLEKKSPEEQAALCLYRLNGKEGEIYFPGSSLQRALVAAGGFSKGKGRASLSRTVAASVFVTPEAIILKPQKYVVDSRPVVVPATRGRVLRHRPRFDQWVLEFEIQYDETMLKESEVRKIVDDAGQKCGVGDFRPACKGPFGRFMVTEWKAA